jgi:ABC-type multidrug transport system ATPase subunit
VNTTLEVKFLEFDDSLLRLKSLDAPTANETYQMLNEASSQQVDQILYNEWNEWPKIANAYNFLEWNYSNFQYELAVYYNYSLSRGRDVPAAFSLITSALSRLITNDTIISLLGIKDVPTISATIDIDLADSAGPFFYMLLLHQLMPVYMSAIVYEKEHRLRELMKMSGLKMWVYWTVMYLWNYLLYFCLMAFLIIAGWFFRFRFFTINSFLLYFILFVVWGHTLVAFSFFLAVFFQKSRTATLVGYFAIIILTFIAFYLIQNVVENLNTSQATLFGISVVPSFALYRGLVYLSMEVENQGPGLKTSESFSGNLDLGPVYIYLAVEWAILMLLTYYLEQVLPGGYGVKRHPLFFLGWTKTASPFTRCKRFFSKRNSTENSSSSSPSSPSSTSRHAIDSDDIDRFPSFNPPSLAETTEDIANERQLAFSQSQTAALSVKNVVKLYSESPWTAMASGIWGAITCRCLRAARRRKSPPKPSVDGVSFVLPQGQCVGILGPNGAGKTSLISIITGLFEPTKGTAEVFGLDVRSDIDKIHMFMGVCPQDNILWPNLTASEHLYFYGRLKNLSRQSLKQEVKQTLCDVKLYKDRNKKAAKFSGGMKRRLSVAIALIGSPKFVVLDEPSTGLDPKSKRQLWTVINKAKRKSSLLLTTHSMEEAEALCNKLIIMAKGKIRAVGSSGQLKSRYGDAFKLSISVNPAVEEEADNFIRTLLPKAKLLNSLAGSRSYAVPKEGTSLAEIFDTMEENKESYEISDWGISNTTLEEVFHRVINEGGETEDEYAYAATNGDDDGDEDEEEDLHKQASSTTDDEDDNQQL